MRLAGSRRWFVLGVLVGAVFMMTSDLYLGDGMRDITEFSDVSAWFNDLPTGENHGCPEILRVLILILSSPSSETRRSAIRETWLQLYQPSPDVVVSAKFVCGIKNLIGKTRQQIVNESKRYEDMMILEELEDSYDKLTWKVLRMLTLASNSMDFHFLLKVDDDSFVHISGLAEALRTMGCPSHLYLGSFSYDGVPHHGGKWAEKHWFMCPHYLPYALGGGYMLSQRLVQLVARFGDKLTIYHNEDVSMGMWMIPYHFQRVDDPRFVTHAFKRNCSDTSIVFHMADSASMLKMKKNIEKNGVLCTVEA